MSGGRFLIVNADDLGLSPAVNEGIFAAHEGGIVTSTSLMVLRPDAPAAVEGSAAHPDLAVGLHLERGEDCRRQMELFRELVGRDPTHLDSHKHVHETDPAFGAAAEALAAELEVPLRNRGIRYERSFYGLDAISPEHLIALIEAPSGLDRDRLPPRSRPGSDLFLRLRAADRAGDASRSGCERPAQCE